MEPTITQEPITQTEPAAQQQPSINQVLGDSLWGAKPQQAPVTVQEPVAQATTTEPTTTQSPVIAEPEFQTIELDEYFRNEFGLPSSELKEKWNKFKDYDTNPPAAPEPKWENDESKRFYDLLRENKRDEIREFLNQQHQIDRLEKLNIDNPTSAAEVLKTNLQFKNRNLSPDDIAFMIEENYAKPSKPLREMDELDDEFSARISQWEQQVQRIDRKMIIDAKLAQNEIPSYKSHIVLPDISQPQVQQTGPSQEELAEMDASRKAYLKAIESDYQKFNGFTVTAKDGDVQLPISYTVAPEENIASRQLIENFNTDAFFSDRWFDEKGTPRVTAIQEDLYLLQNRDKIFQKIANEAVAQAALNRMKVQNNIKLDGVTTNPPVAQSQPKSVNEQLAEAMWKKR